MTPATCLITAQALEDVQLTMIHCETPAHHDEVAGFEVVRPFVWNVEDLTFETFAEVRPSSKHDEHCVTICKGSAPTGKIATCSQYCSQRTSIQSIAHAYGRSPSSIRLKNICSYSLRSNMLAERLL
jgi:hypothetical protein